MTLKRVQAVPGGTGLAPMLAVNDDDNSQVPRVVGYGMLQVVGGTPSWIEHDGYFTAVVDDNGGLGNYTIHQVVPDTHVICVFNFRTNDGPYQDGPPSAAGEINIRNKSFVGAAVAGVVGNPIDADIVGVIWIVAIKVA